MFCTFWLDNVLFATAACNFATSELQKVLRHRQFFNILTSKCVFRHSGVQFCDIRTSGSASELTCFEHFHFKMCFSPQQRAILRHQNSKKCFGADVFLTFSLQNVLFATAACNFATSELQKVLRSWRVPNILTSKCAFRHSGVQFLISLLSTYLRTAALTGLLFDWPDTRIIEKTTFRDFSNIWRGCIFFLLTFALLHLLSADLTTLLCFSTVHIVGSLLFKLPSVSFLCLLDLSLPCEIYCNLRIHLQSHLYNLFVSLAVFYCIFSWLTFLYIHLNFSYSG